jgi:hypothetical protein
MSGFITHTYIHTYIHIQTHTHAHTSTHIHMSLLLLQNCGNAAQHHNHPNTYTYTYTHIHIHTHTYTHTPVHTCTYLCSSFKIVAMPHSTTTILMMPKRRTQTAFTATSSVAARVLVPLTPMTVCMFGFSFSKSFWERFTAC